MATSTIKLFNDVSQLGYANVDFETQKSIFYQFQRYAVRRSIALNNANLSNIFRVQKEVTDYYKAFNSAFIGNYNLSSLLHDGELGNLQNLTNEEFEELLNNSNFERQIALICFSLRNKERIPNRVDYPVLIAYANMQERVLKYYNNGNYIFDAIKLAGDETRAEFESKYGCSMNYEYKTLPSGERVKVDRSVTEKVPHCGTLTACQINVYEEFINTVIADLFSDGKKPVSDVMRILMNKVDKAHEDDYSFDANQRAIEVVYRFLMPTNGLKKSFQNMTRGLERFKNQDYSDENYTEYLKRIIEFALKANVGLLYNNLRVEHAVTPTEYGE